MDTKKELKKAFKSLKYEEKEELASDIWLKITSKNRNMTRLKIWAFSLTGLASLPGIILAWKALLNDLSQSGFYEYLSLVFSNDGSFFAFSKEISLSIAESIPTTSLILSFSLILILFISLKYMTKQIINNSRLSLSINY